MSTAAMIQASRPGIRDFPLADLPFLRFGPSLRHFVDSSADFVLGFRLLAGMIMGWKETFHGTSVQKNLLFAETFRGNACTKNLHAPQGHDSYIRNIAEWTKIETDD